jgi:hypothetical protein
MFGFLDGDCICHRYLTSTPQLTDDVLQKKRQNDSDVHFANDVGTNQQWRGPRKSNLVMFERDDVCSLQIPNVNARKENSDNSTWNGACVDTGAQKTVIGLPQAMSYCRFIGKTFKLQRSNKVYRFGVDKQDSLGSIAIYKPTPAYVITLNVDVVRANVPLLIGLDVVDANGLTADAVSNKLKCPKGGWETPLVRKIGHMYLEWSYDGNILFSKSELTNMHRGFYHPSSENLLNLLKRAWPDDTKQETMQLLQQIASACETCQKRFAETNSLQSVAAKHGGYCVRR